jgi:hypothetical protein
MLLSEMFKELSPLHEQGACRFRKLLLQQPVLEQSGKVNVLTLKARCGNKRTLAIALLYEFAQGARWMPSAQKIVSGVGTSIFVELDDPQMTGHRAV